MANGQIQRYADMVNLQVASEAFLRDSTPQNIRDKLKNVCISPLIEPLER